MMAVDASVVEAVQQALRTPPPAIIQEIESPMPEGVEQFFSWQSQLIDDFEARRRAHIERITRAVDALIARAQEPESGISVDVLNETIVEGDNALASSETAVRAHEQLARHITQVYSGAPFRARVRKAADRIVRATAVQHNALVREHHRLMAAVADLDPEANEVVGSASSRPEVMAMMAELRA